MVTSIATATSSSMHGMTGTKLAAAERNISLADLEMGDPTNDDKNLRCIQ